MRILIPDNRHFHRRNFPMLLDLIRADGISTWRERSHRGWWSRHGDYETLRADLASHIARIEATPAGEWLELETDGINLFSCARGEIFCKLLTLPHCIGLEGSQSDDAFLRAVVLHPESRDTVVLCLAAADHWLCFWARTLEDKGPFSHVLAFSGSQIYNRALLALAARQSIESFVLESFFTGNDCYFERRSTPIANQSLLRDRDYVDGLVAREVASTLDQFRSEAFRRFSMMANKNVRPTRGSLKPPFANTKPTVLIVGQVLNDYSLIETPASHFSSVAFYTRLIDRLLDETDANVIFKAHPWEHKRPNLGDSVTLNALRRMADGLPEDRCKRLVFYEYEAIDALFPFADWVTGLCSQGMLEACYAGLKPVQMGQAFFGGHGFTFDVEQPEELVELVRSDEQGGRLSLEEYRRFENFMAVALVVHLVPNAAEGVVKMRDRLNRPQDPPTAPAVYEQLLAPPPVTPGWREFISNPVPWALNLFHLGLSRSGDRLGR